MEDECLVGDVVGRACAHMPSLQALQQAEGLESDRLLLTKAHMNGTAKALGYQTARLLQPGNITTYDQTT